MLRGGSWANNRNNARAAYRNNNINANDNNGFRLVVVRRPTPHFQSHEEWVRPPLPQTVARSGLACP